MIDKATYERLQAQLNNSKKLASEMENQNRIFGEILTESVKGVDDSQKSKFEELKALCERSMNLAKSGKADEAKALIKTFEKKWQ